MVTTVNRVKPLWTQVVTPISKIELGTIGSILPFNCETSLMRLFSTTPCHRSKEKLPDPSKNDNTTKATTPDPNTNIILNLSKSKRIAVSYAEAENIAEKMELCLLYVKKLRAGDLYRMVPAKELSRYETIQIKQHVMNSNCCDHDFKVTLKKVASNVKKVGEVILHIKPKPRQAMEEPPEYFIGKVKDFMTENSLQFHVLVVKSNSRMLSLSIRNNDLEGRQERTTTEPEASTSDVN